MIANAKKKCHICFFWYLMFEGVTAVWIFQVSQQPIQQIKPDRIVKKNTRLHLRKLKTIRTRKPSHPDPKTEACFFAGASQRVCPNSQPSTFALGKSCKGGMMLKWLSIFYIISVKNYVTCVRQCPRLRCWHSLAVSGNNWYHDAWWDCCNVCCIEVAWFCMAYHIAACGTAICRRKGPPSIFKWQHNIA